MPLTSSQPYLLRAIYEWIVDNSMTPYILVDASNDDVQVPRQFVENGKIVLNIAPRAVNNLQLSNEQVLFDARFSGQPMQVALPMRAVLAIYAKENGQGMVFNETDHDGPPDAPEPAGPDKPKLRLVK
ncbi:MAG: ClpXP protease specificity-enhancing factor [Gammaproteobacteria bacterium]|nr:ClpXP protease specificity-enhancing factor [Gammaproteobacteria bacterium]